MAWSLKKAVRNALVSSSVLRKVAPHVIEELKNRKIVDEFKIGRLSAAASESVGKDAAAFLDRLGATRQVSPSLRRRIHRALKQFEPVWRAWKEAATRCEEVCWSTSPECPLAEDACMALHRERRERSHIRLRPLDHFGFLLTKRFVPPVKFSIPSPDRVFRQFCDALKQPETLYAPPSAMPAVETSHPLAGPSGPEYLLRFPSPSAFAGDTVFARVFAPRRPKPGSPVLVHIGAFGMAYDQLTSWPEEENLARPLAARGYHVVLPESPWHGRRTPPGYSSGELFLATSPTGCITFLSAQVQELSALINWARQLGSSAVSVTGMSLGGMAAYQLATWCRSWPPRLRPDAVLVCAAGSRPEKPLMESSLGKKLGLAGALTAAGWNARNLSSLNVLFTCPEGPGIDPEYIFTVLGTYDTVLPFAYGLDMADHLKLPEQNITVWKTGHLGVLMDMLRSEQGKAVIMKVLEASEKNPNKNSRTG